MSVGTDDNWFSETDDAQSDVLSDTSFSMVYGPGEASEVAMPFSDISVLKSSETTVSDMIDVVLVNSAYPKVQTKQVKSISFSTHEASQRVANTMIHLVGTPSKEKATRILIALAAKFPPSLKVDLRWWDTSNKSRLADSPIDYDPLGFPRRTSSTARASRDKFLAPTPIDPFADTLNSNAGRWVGFNPHDRSFFDVPNPIPGSEAMGHNVFVLYYSNENTNDPTALFNQILESDLGPLASDSLIVPIADYLLDPKAALCKHIPASKRSPLVEIEMEGRSFWVPYTVSQLDAMSLDQLLQRGRGKVTLAHWNNSILTQRALMVGMLSIPVIIMYLVSVAAVSQVNDCVKFGSPSTWPGIASYSSWYQDNCFKQPAEDIKEPLPLCPIEFTPFIPPIESTTPPPATDVLRKVDLAVGLIVANVNTALDHAAHAATVAADRIVQFFRLVAQFVKRLETKVKTSDRVQRFKQSKRLSELAGKLQEGVIERDVNGVATSSQSSAVDEATMGDVLRAHTEPLSLKARDTADWIRAQLAVPMGSEGFTKATQRVSKSLAWLTHPKQTWRDDALRRLGKSSKTWKDGISKSIKNLKTSDVFHKTNSKFRKSKIAGWMLDKASRKNDLAEVSELLRKRSRCGYAWVRDKTRSHRPSWKLFGGK